MIKKIILILMLSFFSSASLAEFSVPPPIIGFEAAEHVHAGDSIKLFFESADIEGKIGTKLPLANGLNLTYGEIMSLAGDFYGIPEAPIVLGKTPQEKQQRFMQAYQTLADHPKALDETAKILHFIYDEQKQLEEGLKKGEKLEDIYLRMAVDHNIEWNCITGGMCESAGISHEQLRKTYFLKQGRYLKLANTDYDHFGMDAWEAYSVGHKLALDEALKGYKAQDVNYLIKAYTLNAFASHFLSDIFSAGHLRTPRYYLSSKVTPSTVGSLLANYMHAEENRLGLFVQNQKGDHWQAFGDTFYFDSRNETNRAILQEALQRSANAVYQTYLTGNIPDSDNSFELIPDIKELSEVTRQQNASPMFYWDGNQQKLFKRKQLNATNDYNWTSYWLGWTTLIELIKDRGIPHVA